jgi:cell division protease FtsH
MADSNPRRDRARSGGARNRLRVKATERPDRGQTPEDIQDKDQRGRQLPPASSPGRGIFFIIAVMLTVAVLFLLFQQRAGQEITLNEFQQLWTDEEIVDGSVEIRTNAIIAKRKPAADSETPTIVRIGLNPASEKAMTEKVLEITGNQAKSRPPSTWLYVLPWLLPIGIIILFVWILSRGLRSANIGGGMLSNFGKSRHRVLSKEMTGVTFKDVAGIDEAKEELAEIIEFLKDPKKFTKLGGRIPRGVLLTGPPGCGKTLLAKAIAGEADVPFFSISGSDFVEMFVGVGASRVRDLFKQAKDSAPCIIFLDEIDAVGRRRGGGFTTGGHDEREQTLNAILVEMDGFTPSDGVIVIAATNRPDVLDPALIRPGRFDRQIGVSLPDVKGRLEILKVHSDKVKLGPDVNLERIARMTPMFSGADLAAIINEAAIAATMLDKEFIEQEDFEEARDKVRFGRAKKSRVREEDDNKLTAYHEAGHAVLQELLPDSDPLHKVTIIPRGRAGGATFSLPEKDRMTVSRKWVDATMRLACGGRIAEEKAMGDISSGAEGDIAQVTQLARLMVLDWGMSPRLGFVRYSGEDTREMFVPEKDYSDETAHLIDEEIRRLVDEAYKDADRMLDANWEAVERVAQALIKYETLDAEEVRKLIRGETLSRASVSDLLAEEARKLAPGSEAIRKRPDPKQQPDTDAPPGMMPSPA